MNEDKLMNARCKIQITQPWYGVFSNRIDWIEDETVGTMGVAIKRGGRINCFYNKDWCNKLSVDELIAVIRHEIEHIVRMHLYRPIGSSEKHHVINNISQDMLINGRKTSKSIENLPDNGMFIPDPNDDKWKNIDLSFFNTINYSSEEVAEWIIKNSKIINSNNGWLLKLSNGNTIHVSLHDNHDIWKKSDASKDEARQTIKEIVKTASKSAGSTPGHLSEYIKQIQVSKVNYIHYLRNLLGRTIGQKRKTYARINRKRMKFGIKGTSSHGGSKLTIMVDVSVSMYTKMLETIFGEIESISQKFKITLIEFDSKVQKVTDYHKGDWQKIEILGRGGTCFESVLKYIEENNLVANANLILTDGECNMPNKRNYSVIWGIIGSQNYNFFKNNKNVWGDLVEIPGEY